MSSIGADPVQIASLVSQSSISNDVGVAVLKKALDSQRAAAAVLIQSLPQVSPLTTEGSVGTQLNVFA